MDALEAAALRRYLARSCAAKEVAAPEFNALDAHRGDGGLGTTLSRCAVQLQAAARTAVPWQARRAALRAAPRSLKRL